MEGAGRSSTALCVYRDPEVLRALLERTRLPDGPDRVALALDDTAQRPYVIVNREGRFITRNEYERCCAGGKAAWRTGWRRRRGTSKSRQVLCRTATRPFVFGFVKNRCGERSEGRSGCSFVTDELLDYRSAPIDTGVADREGRQQ